MLEVLSQMSYKVVEKEFNKVIDSKGKQYLSIKLKLEDILYFEYIKRSRKVIIALTDTMYEYSCNFEDLVEELEQYDFVVNSRGKFG